MSCCQWIYITFLLSRARQSMIDGYGNEFGWRGQESLARDSSPRKDIIVKCDFIFIWKSISSETFHVVVIPKSGKLSWHARGSVTKTITRVKIQSELANWIDFSSQIRFAQPKMFSLNIYVLLWVSWGSPYTKYKSTDPDGIGEGSHESAQREGEADSYRFPSKRLSSRNSTLVEQQRHVDR